MSFSVTTQQYLLSDLPIDILWSIGLRLSVVDLNRLGRVSKLFYKIANLPELWKRMAEKMDIALDEKLGFKEQVRQYCKIDPRHKSQYHFVNDIVGPVTLSTFLAIPEVHLVHTRTIIKDWFKQAPNASVVTGSKWETYLHEYICFMGFSIIEWQREKTIILVKEQLHEMTAGKKDYLIRLMKGLPCGVWQDEKETGRCLPMLRTRDESPPNPKRVRWSYTIVELTLPTSGESFGDPNPGCFKNF